MAQLAALDASDLEGWIDDTLQAIIGADDYTTRWCVATRDPHGNHYIFGPYATSDAATKAVESGNCASSKGTLASVLPLIPSPKIPRSSASSTSPVGVDDYPDGGEPSP
jgi:hypothetical protein